MIYFLYGSDSQKARVKSSEVTLALQKKKPGATFISLTDDTWGEVSLEECIGGQGLFEHKYIVFFDNVFKHKQAKEEVVKRLKDLKASDNVCIFLEEKVDKATLTKIEKVAEKIQEFVKKEGVTKKEFNIFALTDALAARDKKKLWLLYLDAVKRDIVPEEVSGVLFWKVKQMIQSKNFRAFTEIELKMLSSELVTAYHDAHRGIVDFTVALERIILKM